MIDILDRTYEPSLSEINNFIQDKARARWLLLLDFINDNFNPKTQITYSSCSAKPGWNVKHKKSSKAICTMYPSEDYFTVLIVLNQTDMEWFKGIKGDLTDYVVNQYENSGMMNGTKWIMIDVTDDDVLNDVKEIIELKLEKQ